MERLGHVIRKYRCELTRIGPTQIKVTAEDLRRILDAADRGLYLSVKGPQDAAAFEKQLNDLDAVCISLRDERNNLRKSYVVDLKRIQDLGYQDLNDIITNGSPRVVETLKARIIELKKQVNALSMDVYNRSKQAEEWQAPYPEIEEAEGLPF